MPVRTVLIPLDGTDTPSHIVRIVRSYIGPDEVKLVLLRSIELDSESSGLAHLLSDIPPSDSQQVGADKITENNPLSQSPSEMLLCQLRQQLAAEVEILRSAGYTVTVEVRFGETVQQIVEYVAEKHVALVALATSAYTGNGKPLPGSLAEKIVRGLSVPVLLMRTNAGERSAKSSI